MERILLLLTLAMLPLSGCLDDGDTASTESVAEPTALSYEPVLIDESINLAAGEAGRNWAFTIGPEATAANVRFEITGLAEGTHAQKVNWCFTLDSTHHRAYDCVPPGNVNVQITVVGTRTLYDWSHAPAGDYAIHFDSAPATGVFHAYVNVQY